MLSCLLIPVELHQFNQVEELTSLFTKYLQISFCAKFQLQISVPDVIKKNATNVLGTILINHFVQLHCALQCSCAAWGEDMVYGIARWKTGMIWGSQTLLWVSDATVFVPMQLSHALTEPLKIKSSLLLFQLLMDWNNMNEHEIPSSLLTLPSLRARQELCYFLLHK